MSQLLVGGRIVKIRPQFPADFLDPLVPAMFLRTESGLAQDSIGTGGSQFVENTDDFHGPGDAAEGECV